jgi:hypothetical protein
MNQEVLVFSSGGASPNTSASVTALRILFYLSFDGHVLMTHQSQACEIWYSDIE